MGFHGTLGVDGEHEPAVALQSLRDAPAGARLHFEAGGHRLALQLRPDGAGAEVSVAAASEESQRLLRNALVGRAELVQDGRERHVLGTVPAHHEGLPAGVEEKMSWVRQTVHALQTASTRGREVPPGFLNLLWWDGRPNFGDAVGPWLARHLSGLTPVNGFRRGLRTPALATAGSIAGWLEQDGSQIWGSGLMAPLEGESLARLRSLKGVRVSAVRGRNTRTELLRKTGWDFPAVYGDPALLLPQFLAAGGTGTGDIAVVPHLDHRDCLEKAAGPGVTVVDVREGVEAVVGKIAGSQACISSSLHGIIVAQAYGVPWVWLRISDRVISGDRYKFEDFFTTLDASGVRAADVPARELTPRLVERLAARAVLPELTIDLAPLLESFPHGRA
ncbi:polysaccharide pyruvyl transferase family protein [Arthrobacter gandavensis]|uniref:polysaccharide pyruvyl transferase family protein n=1 Tax=Arthrobacter gandavensis TaxID=169960 RepID=UPI00188E57D6|nr:polysaccharide pyruvyl transferase family protein [Arthrobacter gandavensis]MBF4995508.1 polysaccharide pyruvyl transferase family protein [Arthrobacter gandavensis]